MFIFGNSLLNLEFTYTGMASFSICKFVKLYIFHGLLIEAAATSYNSMQDLTAKKKKLLDFNFFLVT